MVIGTLQVFTGSGAFNCLGTELVGCIGGNVIVDTEVADCVSTDGLQKVGFR